MTVHGTTSHRSVTSRPRGGRGVLRLALLAVVTVVVMAAGVACGSAAKPPAAPSSPAATSTTSPTDAAALLRASAATMDAKAKTGAFTATYSSTATLNGATDTKTMQIAGDITSDPEALRAKGTTKVPGVGTLNIEMIGIEDAGYLVGYMRVVGVTGWQLVPRAESDIITTSVQDTEALLKAAKSAAIVRTETIRGVLCDVVQVNLDPAVYDKADKGLGLASSMSQELHISLAAAAAALSNGTGTESLWVGRDDHFMYRDSRDFSVDAGSLGKYVEQGTMDFFDFGKTVDPPITAPDVSSPLPTV
jgi:hypothetical protein